MTYLLKFSLASIAALLLAVPVQLNASASADTAVCKILGVGYARSYKAKYRITRAEPIIYATDSFEELQTEINYLISNNVCTFSGQENCSIEEHADAIAIDGKEYKFTLRLGEDVVDASNFKSTLRKHLNFFHEAGICLSGSDIN
jgi:hypothetical protein